MCAVEEGGYLFIALKVTVRRRSEQLERDDQTARLYLEGFDLLLDPRFVLAAAVEAIDRGLRQEQGERLIEGGQQRGEGGPDIGRLGLDRDQFKIAQIDGA